MTASLATALFGGGASPSAPTAAVALATFRGAIASGAEAKGVARTQKDPATLAAITQFKKAVDGATDLKKALMDPRILTVLLPAVGLGSKQDQAGLVRQVLLSDPGKSDSLASKLGGNWLSAAKTLNLGTLGLAALKDPATIATLTQGYLTYQYRKGLDARGVGVADALYFREQASTVTNVYSLLGDSVMRRVVTGAFGLPDAMAVQPIETQAAAITARLDLAKLQKPAEVDKLIQKYLISQAGTGMASSPILSLFA